MSNRPLLQAYSPNVRKYRASREQNLHRAVCSYLRMQYPQVLFRSDYAGVNNMSKAARGMMKALQSTRAFPDLFLYHPRKVDGKQYAGMALELKKEGTKIILNNGKLTANPHIQEQYFVLQTLNKSGYWADFGIGLDDAIEKIDYYMGKPENSALPF